MDGKLYYTFKAPKEDVRFFALESTYMDPDQLKWLEDELKKSSEKWKIAFFHHPLYSSARTHGSQLKLREVLEPLFIQYNVSLVLNGHDHTYERIKPQNGIQYFVEGSSGQLRNGDLRKGSPLTAFGNDTDSTFMLMEIDGDTLTFNTISTERQRHRLRAAIDRAGSSRRAARERAGIERPSPRALSCSSASRPRRPPGSSATMPPFCDDDADFAPALELQLAQALAADEGARCRRG